MMRKRGLPRGTGRMRKPKGGCRPPADTFLRSTVNITKPEVIQPRRGRLMRPGEGAKRSRCPLPKSISGFPVSRFLILVDL
jgi:hypothetical protein